MKILKWSVLLLLAAIMTVMPNRAQEPGSGIFDRATDPASLIGSYYNAIHTGDYPRAYNYWQTPPQGNTLQQFTAGFSDTISASVLVRLPILIDAGAGNLYASVPVVVSAQHTDGTFHVYIGCFTAHKANMPIGDAIEPPTDWQIQSGTLAERTNPDLAKADDACVVQSRLVEGGIAATYDDPLLTVQNYFVALATGAAGTAATLWHGTDIFAAPFGQQIYYALDNDLFVNPVIYPEGTAGSTYATVPVLLLVTAPDDVQQYITACFVTRAVTAPQGDAGLVDTNFYLDGVTVQPPTGVISALLLTNSACDGNG